MGYLFKAKLSANVFGPSLKPDSKLAKPDGPWAGPSPFPALLVLLQFFLKFVFWFLGAIVFLSLAYSVKPNYWGIYISRPATWPDPDCGKHDLDATQFCFKT